MSVNGDLYVPAPYNEQYTATYTFDDPETVYTISDGGVAIAEIRFIPQPFN